MPDTGKLARLIERRKSQERQNDRIRIHKNKLDNMRLEKLSGFFDWSKSLLKQEHLNVEAKCIKNLEKIYERQCKIEDEKKKSKIKKQEQEDERCRIKNSESSDGSYDARKTSSPPTNRPKVTSATKQEQAKSFMSKAKALSAGYRDNDPPQSYYKRKGIPPPDRVVTPDISYSAQAQTGGGFYVPPSALHVRYLKKWHGIPEDTGMLTPGDNEFSRRASPPPERPYSVFEALKAIDGGEGLEILREEDESTSGESSARSSIGSDADYEIQQVRMVNIRPSTAPGMRGPPEEIPYTRQLTLPDSENPTTADEGKPNGDKPEPKGRGILLKRLSERPATARPGILLGGVQEDTSVRRQSFISFADVPKDDKEDEANEAAINKRLQMRRHSSAISFSDLPPQEGRRLIATPPRAMLHRRKSNVAAIHRSIQQQSKLLRPKSNKMRKKSGGRMGLLQSVMSNVENDVLIRKLQEKSRSLEEERARRLRVQRVHSAPAGGRQIQIEENYPSLRRLSLANREAWRENPYIKDKGQKALLEANTSYSTKLDVRVKAFSRP